jgi:hypothetical protein
MAYFETAVAAKDGSFTVDAEATNPVGTEARDTNGNEFLYLRGVAGCVAGSVVTFDSTGQTALLAANAKGPVAVAGGPTVAGYGWFCVKAPLTFPANVAPNCAANALVGREGADGVVGDGRLAGDQIHNFWTRGATGGVGALVPCQFRYPCVDDAYGA